MITKESLRSRIQALVEQANILGDKNALGINGTSWYPDVSATNCIVDGIAQIVQNEIDTIKPKSVTGITGSHIVADGYWHIVHVYDSTGVDVTSTKFLKVFSAYFTLASLVSTDTIVYF